MIQSINPFTEELIAEYKKDTVIEVDKKIKELNKSFLAWKNKSFEKRSEVLLRISRILLDEIEKYSVLISSEMGKPIEQSRAEVKKCAWICEYYAKNAETFLKEEKIETNFSESYLRFDPLGVILAIMPWNFPFWQVFRFAAPALMAGNVCLLKHASNVTGCSLEIQEIFERASIDLPIFKSIIADSELVKYAIRQNEVKAATLTGSESAGKAIGCEAGIEIKKTVMELGGSDPFIVLNDADIEEAAKNAVYARLINNGQSCIAAKRFIIEKNVYDKFVDLFIENLLTKIIGNPLENNTDIGPLARKDLAMELEKQTEISLKKGAKLAYRMSHSFNKGYFFSPAVLVDIPDNSPAYEEELFGPVASIFKAEDIDEIISIANNTSFGLGASIWTSKIDIAKKIAEKIEAGNVFINHFVLSDPRLPFGGVKKSGFGRELSHYGIKEFVNIKTVAIK